MFLYRSILVLLVFSFAFKSFAENVWDKPSPTSEEPIEITVYRSPSCGCCGIWLDHIKSHHFVVTDVPTENVDSIKQRYGVTPQLASCHTAVVDDFVIEGHVPASDIRKLLTEKPDIVGLAVPGMPHGTPGMEMSGRKEPFSVISFDKNGDRKAFTEYLFY